MRNGYKFVDHHDRVAIIYDNLVHDLQPMAISKERNIHYNTVRHILHRFYEDGHLKIKKSINDGSKAKNTKIIDEQKEDPAQADPTNNSDQDTHEQTKVSIPIAKSKRRYRKKIVKAKVTNQLSQITNEDTDSTAAEPVRDFIIPGPLNLDLPTYHTACPIALYVDIDDKHYETVGQEGLGICGGSQMYPFDIPKLNQAEYQDERGEIGDKYQISDILKSIKT